ncbi:hypothetical protein DLREEDagrD3_28850 [Denitratisoma sp. agr-D3]
MSIFLKTTIDNTLEELQRHYQELEKALKGRILNNQDMMYLGYDPTEKGKPEMVAVNVEDVLDKVAHFKTAVDNLRRINQRAHRKT